MTLLLLQDKNFPEAIKEGVTLVDFWAPWCGNCEMMKPIIAELTQEFGDKVVKIAELNIEENSKITQRFNIKTLPTFIIFKDGIEQERLVGVRSKGEFQEKLKRLV